MLALGVNVNAYVVGGIVTFGVYRFWRAYIDGYSALGVVYEVSLEVVMTTHA